MLGKYLDNYIARETNRSRDIQGPMLRTTPGLPTILTMQPSTNSWICPCGATFPFGPNNTTIPPPQQPWKPAPTQVESYVEFTLSPAHKPQRHDYNITLTRTHAGRWRADDVKTLTTPWIMDESFFEHLVQNPLHASAFARELNRNGTFIKLVRHSGPKDSNVRLVVRYSGPTPASNTLVSGQRWKFRYTKAPWHPLAKVFLVWVAFLYLSMLVLVVGISKRLIRIDHAASIWIRVVVLVCLIPLLVMAYVLWRVTRMGRRIR